MKSLFIKNFKFFKIKKEIQREHALRYTNIMNDLLQKDELYNIEFFPATIKDSNGEWIFGWNFHFKSDEDKTNFILRWMD